MVDKAKSKQCSWPIEVVRSVTAPASRTDSRTLQAYEEVLQESCIEDASGEVSISVGNALAPATTFDSTALVAPRRSQLCSTLYDKPARTCEWLLCMIVKVVSIGIIVAFLVLWLVFYGGAHMLQKGFVRTFRATGSVLQSYTPEILLASVFCILLLFCAKLVRGLALSLCLQHAIMWLYEAARDVASSMAEACGIQVTGIMIGRFNLIRACLPMQIDQALDGKVMVKLVRNGLNNWAAAFFFILFVPQLLVWYFLYQNKMARVDSLGRVIFFPALSVLGLASVWLASSGWISAQWIDSGALATARDTSVWMACISLDPLWEIVRSWKGGERSEHVIWAEIGEGLLEASSSSVLTLTMILTNQISGDFWTQMSILTSCHNVVQAALMLDDYGQQDSPQISKTLCRALFVVLPRVISRVTTLALAGYLATFTSSWGMTICLCVVILVSEICTNAVIIQLVNNKVPKAVLALFSVTTLFVDPPGFLTALDPTRLPLAFLQFVHLVLCLVVALCTSSAMMMPIQSLLRSSHQLYAIAWLITTPWCLAVSIWMAPGELRSFEDRASAANSQLRKAARAQDKILCNLLLEIEGAERSSASSWIFAKTLSLPSTCKGGWKWNGIAAFGDKLFCCPHHVDGVLVIHPESGSTSIIPTGISGDWKWSGLVACGQKLYCCPLRQSCVLVIDPISLTTDTIATSFKGCSGIAAYENSLYCVPGQGSQVLVIDAETNATSTIDTGFGDTSGWKWCGIAVLEKKLYCAPCDSEDVLVIDPTSRQTSTIPTGVRGSGKWSGIAAFGGKLYCSPGTNSNVQVVDPSSKKTLPISSGLSTTGSDWLTWGIAACDDKLYCAPNTHGEVLVIDPVLEAVDTIPTGHTGNEKWRGIAALHGKLYCGPSNADVVLADVAGIIDERALLDALGV